MKEKKENDQIFENYKKSIVKEDKQIPIKFYYIIGYNERGPWRTYPMKSAFALNWRDLYTKLNEVYELSKLKVNHRSGNSVVLSVPAEYTIVIAEDPVVAKQLYAQYNEDNGSEWR